MQRWIGSIAVTLMMAGSSALAAPTPHVFEQYGNISYVGTDNITRSLTTGGNFGEPVLSPDGRTVAFVHIEGKPSDDFDGPQTSLWIADGPSGKAHRLIGPHPADDMKAIFMSFSHPLFSLDGHFVYLTVDAWATSPAVHQVSITTGQERFVIDGGAASVIRTGPYRGYLLVGRHMYYAPPKTGSYNPVYVVRPDGKAMFPVPGSVDDDENDHMGPWLKSHGWTAW
jgi:hypothetical protein